MMRSSFDPELQQLADNQEITTSNVIEYRNDFATGQGQYQSVEPFNATQIRQSAPLSVATKPGYEDGAARNSDQARLMVLWEDAETPAERILQSDAPLIQHQFHPQQEIEHNLAAEVDHLDSFMNRKQMGANNALAEDVSPQSVGPVSRSKNDGKSESHSKFLAP